MEDFILTKQQDRQVILLADDDEDDVLLFKEALASRSEELYINIAGNGLEAISSLQKQPLADIIFLDVNMPRMKGLECLSEIRNLSETIPVIILTTSSNPDLVEQAKALGASGFISKPLNFKRYQKVMNEVLAIDWTQKDQQFYLSILNWLSAALNLICEWTLFFFSTAQGKVQDRKA